MKRFVTCLSVLTFALTLVVNAQEKSAQEVTIKRAAPKVGEIVVAKRGFDMGVTIQVSLDGNVVQEMEQGQKEDSEVKVEVLAVDGNNITKAKILVVKQKDSTESPMGPMERDSALVGKPVIAEIVEGMVKFTNEKGEALSDEEETAAKEFKSTDGKSIRIHAFDSMGIIPDKAMKMGEPVEISEEKAKNFFKDATDETKMKINATVTLKEVKEMDGVKYGVLELSGKIMFDQEEQGIKGSFEPKGDILVAIETGRGKSATLKGPFKLSGGQEQGGQQIDIAGDGSGSLNASWDWSMAAAK